MNLIVRSKIFIESFNPYKPFVLDCHIKDKNFIIVTSTKELLQNSIEKGRNGKFTLFYYDCIYNLLYFDFDYLIFGT